MIASLIASIEEFVVAGLVSLAILLATIRANCTKWTNYFESAGFSGVFIFCLFLTLGGYGIFAVRRHCVESRRNEGDEESEVGEERGRTRHPRFRIFPVILDWRYIERSRGRRGVIRLDGGIDLAGWCHLFPMNNVNNKILPRTGAVGKKVKRCHDQRRVHEKNGHKRAVTQEPHKGVRFASKVTGGFSAVRGLQMYNICITLSWVRDEDSTIPISKYYI